FGFQFSLNQFEGFGLGGRQLHSLWDEQGLNVAAAHARGVAESLEQDPFVCDVLIDQQEPLFVGCHYVAVPDLAERPDAMPEARKRRLARDRFHVGSPEACFVAGPGGLVPGLKPAKQTRQPLLRAGYQRRRLAGVRKVQSKWNLLLAALSFFSRRE